MLSIEQQTVYDILLALTGETEVYKIIEADEVLQKLPPAVRLTKIQLSQLIRDLKDRDYIDVKYFTPEEYCLQIIRRQETPQAQPQAAEQADAPKGERVPYGEKKQKAEAPRVKSGVVFLMAFLGGLMGSAIVAAVTVLIIKFVV